MMQSAAWWGTWGLSFVTILLCGVLALMGRGDRRQVCAPAARSSPSIAGAVRPRRMAAGARGRRGPGRRHAARHLLRLVQGNIDQMEKLTGAHRDRDIMQHVRLSTATPGLEQVQAVIWPETAATVFLDRQDDWRTLVATAAPPSGLLVTGTLRGDPPQGEPERYWNSLAVIDPTGAHRGDGRQVPSGSARRICADARHPRSLRQQIDRGRRRLFGGARAR